MMRAEMLKKLDELMAGLLRSHAVRPLGQEGVSQYVPYLERRQWEAIRAEIVAERCDACARWLANSIEPDACCSHFEKAKKEPSDG